MADVKISALGAIGSVAGEDLVAIVDDPSGTPASRKATITQIATFINASALSASSTATFTNKTFDVEGTGNSISNIDVADLKSGVLDTDISSVSGSDDTIPSAKAVKTYVDAQIATEDTLEELNDTTITSVGDNELLQYDSTSSKWINQTLAEAGISPVAGSSSIVTVGTIATGTWNGTAIADAYLGTGINATKIADGSVTSTEFQYINTLSSNAQTQLDAKAPLASPTFTGNVTTPSSVIKNQGTPGLAGLTFEPTASNSIGHLVINPSGTNNRAQLSITRQSDPTTNIDALTFGSDIVSTNEFGFRTFSAGTGTTRPFSFYVDSTKVLNFPANASGIEVNVGMDMLGTNIDNVQNIIHDISTTGLDIDFSEDQLQTYSVSGNVTFTTFQNITAGKSKTIRVSADGTDRVLTFPANIRWLGTAPDSNTYTVTANKMAILTFTSFSTDEANILGVFALEE